MLIVQLSDLHLTLPGTRLYGRVDTDGALVAAVARCNALVPRPDLVVLSGDLVDGGSVAEYRHLAARLADLAMPWCVMPGNHDRREGLAEVFGLEADASGRCHQRLETPAGDLLLVDTAVAGEEWGEVDLATLDWLEASLHRDRESLLFMHHPPFPVGIPGLDAIACRGSEPLDAWLRLHPEVVAVLCGHVHRSCCSSFAGRVALTAPSPAHQIALELAGAPDDLAYTLEPGGFLLHRWLPGQALISHYLPVVPAPVHRYAG